MSDYLVPILLSMVIPLLFGLFLFGYKMRDLKRNADGWRDVYKGVQAEKNELLTKLQGLSANIATHELNLKNTRIQIEKVLRENGKPPLKY